MRQSKVIQSDERISVLNKLERLLKESRLKVKTDFESGKRLFSSINSRKVKRNFLALTAMVVIAANNFCFLGKSSKVYAASGKGEVAAGDIIQAKDEQELFKKYTFDQNWLLQIENRIAEIKIENEWLSNENQRLIDFFELVRKSQDGKLKDRYQDILSKVKLLEEKAKVLEEEKVPLTANRGLIENVKSIEFKKALVEIKNAELKKINAIIQNYIKDASGITEKLPKNYILPPEITINSLAYERKPLGEFTITAYAPTVKECGNDKGITSSGQPIRPGFTVAVDQQFWEVGTLFYIEGIGIVVAMDTGGAIDGVNRFDFAIFGSKLGDEFGVQKKKVYLLKEGNGKIDDIKF